MARATRRTRYAGLASLGGMVAAALLWACSSSSSASPVLGDSYGSDGGEITLDGTTVVDSGTTPSEAAPSACTLVEAGCVALENCGPKVNVTRVAQTPPVAAGGAVVPGTYVMTDYTIYTGAGGATGGAGAWIIETQYLSLMGADGGSPTEGGAAEAGDDGGSDAEADDAGAPAEAGPVAQVFQLLDVSETDTNAATTLTGTSTFASPSRATIAYGCPSDAGTFETVFTATSTTYQLFVSEPSGGDGVITYTKM